MFNILVENVTNNPVKVNARQFVATANDNLGTGAHSNIMHTEMIGLTTTMYTKRCKNVCDTDPVNKHLGNERIAELGTQDEEPITSENVEIHAAKEYHPRIRTLLRKYEYQ